MVIQDAQAGGSGTGGHANNNGDNGNIHNGQNGGENANNGANNANTGANNANNGANNANNGENNGNDANNGANGDANNGNNGENNTAGAQPSAHFFGALALITPFNGLTEKPTIYEFTKAVTAAGKLARCTPHQLAEAAKLKLSDAANTFLDAHPELDDVDWPTLERALLRRFDDAATPKELYNRLNSCTQQANETVMMYAGRLKNIGIRALKDCPQTIEESNKN